MKREREQEREREINRTTKVKRVHQPDILHFEIHAG